MTTQNSSSEDNELEDDCYAFVMDEHILRRELRQVEAAFLQNCRTQALGIYGSNYQRSIRNKDVESDQEKQSHKQKLLRSPSSFRSPPRSQSPLSSGPKSPSQIRSASPGFGSSPEDSSDFSEEDTDRSNSPIIRDEKMSSDENEQETHDSEKPVFRSL
ncbi:uncharacterized protein LOC114364862 [Ostrinia furnacalis]|uniref:uncharacterized protein LOC114364862 n=1 Tax=Ostrinia furnacalis TaxID=93504 RepID=UPI0010393F8A|nr:uncharacterized protein LOC114364862 [Ostrinia furnacalis]